MLKKKCSRLAHPARSLIIIVIDQFGAIAGSVARCKNKAMSELMKKLAPCVGVFRYSAVNNDMLKELQKLEEDLHLIYELIRRNDTR